MNNKTELILRGLKRIKEYFVSESDIEFGLFIINHLYSLIEIDNYSDESKSIRKINEEEKKEIFLFLKHEFPKEELLKYFENN